MQLASFDRGGDRGGGDRDRGGTGAGARILALLALAAPLALATPAARADGEISLRGVYYKEKATRVVQPMMDGHFDVGEHGSADGHLLVDAITSASTAAGAADRPFDEKRYEVGGGYQHELSRMRLGGQARVSYEPDYTSLFAGTRGQIDLADKNLVLGAGGGVGHDWISNAGDKNPMTTRIDRALDSVLGSVSASQILGRNLVASITYDVSYLSGFQANPYRMITIAPSGKVDAEHHPEHRTRHAVAGTARLFVPATETTLVASYRFYGDDWGLIAHTPEARIIQAAGERAELTLRFRYHRQGAADFYRDSYPSDDPTMFPYVTADPKLAAFTSQTYGFKVSALFGVLGFDGRLGATRGEIDLEYLIQDNAFGNAGIAHAGLSFPIDY